MRRSLFFLLSLGLSLAHAHCPAHAHGAHQHGVAQLTVAVEAATVSIRLESPLDNLLGFERTPRTEKERAAAAALLSRLQRGEGLFALTQAAGCTLVSATVDAPVLQGGKAEAGHADLTAEWRYTCRAPDRLTGLRVLFFRDHKRLTRLEAAVAGPRGQRADRLSARAPDLAW